MISKVKGLFFILMVGLVMFGQEKSDKWHLYANSR